VAPVHVQIFVALRGGSGDLKAWCASFKLRKIIYFRLSGVTS
jgi:hypothetical protein